MEIISVRFFSSRMMGIMFPFPSKRLEWTGRFCSRPGTVTSQKTCQAYNALMPVVPYQLTHRIADYNRVNPDRKLNTFVCPITLRKCQPQELIDGHILPQAIVRASRRTIIQYGDVDHFYGTRVEASFVRYLN